MVELGNEFNLVLFPTVSSLEKWCVNNAWLQDPRARIARKSGRVYEIRFPEVRYRILVATQREQIQAYRPDNIYLDDNLTYSQEILDEVQFIRDLQRKEQEAKDPI